MWVVWLILVKKKLCGSILHVGHKFYVCHVVQKHFCVNHFFAWVIFYLRWLKAFGWVKNFLHGSKVEKIGNIELGRKKLKHITKTLYIKVNSP